MGFLTGFSKPQKKALLSTLGIPVESCLNTVEKLDAAGERNMKISSHKFHADLAREKYKFKREQNTITEYENILNEIIKLSEKGECFYIKYYLPTEPLIIPELTNRLVNSGYTAKIDFFDDKITKIEGLIRLRVWWS